MVSFFYWHFISIINSSFFLFLKATPLFAPKVQEKAPDFKGTAVIDGNFKEIKLSDYQGKYLVLFFYPLDL